MDNIKAPVVAKHLNYLDGLRALAAIFVILHHAFLQVHINEQQLNRATVGFIHVFKYGHYAVDLFIVLSGFCLMLPVARGDGTLRGGAARFFVRRAWRILPTYYLALAFSLLCIWTLVGQDTGTHWDISVPVTTKSIFTHLFMVYDIFVDEFSINHAFWSIVVEWRIYFFFPLLVIFWRRFGPFYTTLLALIFSALLFKTFNKLLGFSLSAHYIGLFAMGMLGASIAFDSSDKLVRARNLSWPAMTIVLTAVVMFLSLFQWKNGQTTPIQFVDYAVGLWSLTLLIWASNDNLLSRVLSWRPLVFIGTFAYSIYLIHAPLLQICWQYLFYPWKSNPLAMFALLSFAGTPFILGVSYAFFLLCERPFLTKGKTVGAQTLSAETALNPAP